MTSETQIQLPPNAPMQDYHRYIHELESMHGWLDVDLVKNCFLLGEEVGELFKSIRKYERFYIEGETEATVDRKKDVAEELVDVFNYLLAIANRLDIDLEEAFREKNAINQGRSWT